MSIERFVVYPSLEFEAQSQHTVFTTLCEAFLAGNNSLNVDTAGGHLNLGRHQNEGTDYGGNEH
ncbi:hypothetical protein SAMN04487917_102619 [Arthrobacter sp. yr096]|uniref:hypothetical protein n=1 Tax=unclassified Arthrobacter TaxID=235627 RepID=UPI000897B7CB|nr:MULTISPECIES: hypothetical protein [unclassified Arthrobacter]SDX56264.1 hypothetical protein SAMN04487912_11713 [Arthrobacter sp. cf158]SEI85129.1 hypothetical protein SAMN04487917_102619 [Arthrobacter sp. yr096]